MFSGERPGFNPVQIEERRLDGVTYAGILAQNPRLRELGLDKFPQGPDDIYFESGHVLDVSGDNQHVLVIGEDGNRRALIKDGEFLLRDYAGIDVTGIKRDDFSRLVVRATDNRGRQSAFLFYQAVSGHTEKLLLESADNLFFVRVTENLDYFLLSHYGEGKTYFDRFDRDGIVVGSFKARGQFEAPRLVAASDDLLSVVWKGEKGGTTLFRNNEKIAEGSNVDSRASQDTKRILAVVTHHSGIRLNYWQEIILNGKRLYRGRWGQRVDRLVANRDVTLAAARLRDLEGGRECLFILRGDSFSLCDPFDTLGRMSIEEDKRLTAEVFRRSVRYEISASS